MLSRGYMGESLALEDFKAKAPDWIWLFISILLTALIFYLSCRNQAAMGSATVPIGVIF